MIYNASRVAEACGLKSSQQLNKLLEALGVQTSFMYNERKYWKLTEQYQGKGYEAYKKPQAKYKLLATLRWTEKGLEFIQHLVYCWQAWQKVYADEPTNALHMYTNKAQRKVIQLTPYDPNEPLDGTRVYIPESVRKRFAEDVRNFSTYYRQKRYWNPYAPCYAIDDRDPGLLAKWERWIKNYYRFNVLLSGD